MRHANVSILVLVVVVVKIVATLPFPDLGSPDSSRFTFYDIPPPVLGPCDLCEGPDGAVWGDALLSPHIFRIDPKSRRVDFREIPFTEPELNNFTLPRGIGRVAGRTAFACAIRPGADGHIYAAFGTRNQLVQINVTTFEVKIVLSLSILGNLEPFNDLYTSPDGMWFTMTTANMIGFYSYNTSQVTIYNVPTPLANPLGIYYASDGIVYFCELLADKMGMLDPRTSEIKEYIIPLGGKGPAVVRAETSSGGKHPFIWFTGSLSNSVGRLNPNTGEIKLFFSPLIGGVPAENTVDRDSNVWFVTTTQNIVGKIDPRGTVSYVTIPGTLSLAPVSIPLYFVFAITFVSDNALWFDLLLNNTVGRYSLS